MVFIYILELENNKYYVGKTTNPNFRLEQHFTNSGSQWTKKYKPIKILELKQNCDDYDEDKYTRMYMDKYGINNVRGGSYVQLKLDKITIQNLEKMNRGTTDKCFLCGEKGHFVKDCNDNYEHVWICEYCDKQFTDENKCQLHENKCKLEYVNKLKISKNIIQENEIIDTLKIVDKIFNFELTNIYEFCQTINKSNSLNTNFCSRCGRNGHYSNECYANTNIDKEEISESSEEEIEVFCCSYCDKEFETLKGVTCHENLYCKYKNNKSNKNITNKKNVCYRCGRDGHYSNDCYASKHINGKHLG
jgi:hypothetical protein